MIKLKFEMVRYNKQNLQKFYAEIKRILTSIIAVRKYWHAYILA